MGRAQVRGLGGRLDVGGSAKHSEQQAGTGQTTRAGPQSAQVASTPDQRSIGLMFRREMPANEGMLFIFEQPQTQCFWMKNTLLPLTAAFVADDGTIVNLADMKPQTTDSHCSTQPVRFVLEMHQGWFDKRGIKAGTRLSGQLFAVRP